MLDLLTSSGNHRSERGLARRNRYLLLKLTLSHARTMVVHSACCICLLAQVTIAVCADWRDALATCCCSLALRMPAPWTVHSACRTSTASPGNHRSARIGTALPLPYASLPLCACTHLGQCTVHVELLTSSGNRRSARIGTALSLPAMLAYSCACLHLGQCRVHSAC
jgi:hypothetical protein